MGDSSGVIWSFGDNYYGQLGHGRTDPVLTPRAIRKEGVPYMQSVACGGAHTLFIDEIGSLWGCGFNHYGQLGITGHTGSIYEPKKVNSSQNNIIRKIEAGYNHSIFINEEGRCFTCGTNTFGELGREQKQTSLGFSSITSLPPLKSVAAGMTHTLFLTVDGQLYGSGRNEQRQLGIPDEANRKIPTHIELPEIILISCGMNHSLAVDVAGDLWTFGHNEYGLGVGGFQTLAPTKIHQITNVRAISSGGIHSIVKNDTNIFAF